MLIDTQLFRARVGIYNAGLPFLKKALNVSQNNKCFLCNSCQSFVLFNFSAVLSFSSKYAFTFSQNQYKFFYNGCEIIELMYALCNGITTICISITGMLMS